MQISDSSTQNYAKSLDTRSQIKNVGVNKFPQGKRRGGSISGRKKQPSGALHGSADKSRGTKSKVGLGCVLGAHSRYWSTPYPALRNGRRFRTSSSVIPHLTFTFLSPD